MGAFGWDDEVQIQTAPGAESLEPAPGGDTAREFEKQRVLDDYISMFGQIAPGVVLFSVKVDVAIRFPFDMDEEPEKAVCIPANTMLAAVYNDDAKTTRVNEVSIADLEGEIIDSAAVDAVAFAEGGPAVKADAGGGSLRMKTVLTPIETVEPGEGMHYHELFAWIEIGEAMRAGDSAAAESVFYSVYRPIEIEDIPPEAESTPRRRRRGTGVRPETHYFLDSEFTGKLRGAEIPAGELMAARIEGKAGARLKRDRETVETLFSFTCTDGGKVVQLTDFDVDVHQAFASLWAANVQRRGAFEIRDIDLYNAFYHVETKYSSQAPTVVAVTESVKKQMRYIMYLDFSEELRGRKARFNGETFTAERAVMERNVIYAIAETVEGEGEGGTVFTCSADFPPMLYWHDSSVKRIQSVPERMLFAMTAGANTNANRRRAVDYLGYRIEKARAGKMSNRITYKTLFERAGIADKSETVKKRMRKFVEHCLDSLKESEDPAISIKDWHGYGYGPHGAVDPKTRAIKGVEIIL